MESAACACPAGWCVRKVFVWADICINMQPEYSSSYPSGDPADRCWCGWSTYPNTSAHLLLQTSDWALWERPHLCRCPTTVQGRVKQEVAILLLRGRVAKDTEKLRRPASHPALQGQHTRLDLYLLCFTIFFSATIKSSIYKEQIRKLALLFLLALRKWSAAVDVNSPCSQQISLHVIAWSMSHNGCCLTSQERMSSTCQSTVQGSSVAWK